MTELELDTLNGPAAQRRPLHLDWILPLLLHPRRTLERVVKQDAGVWAAPLLLLTLAAVLMVFAQGPVLKMQAQMTSTMPESAMYFTEEQLAQLQEGMNARQGPVFIYVFPAIGVLVGVWVNWILLSSLLHLALTMAGSRSGSVTSFNLAAWAGVPLVFRFLVRAIYSFSTRQMVTSPGLSGLLAPGGTGFAAFLGAVLTLVDLYLLWQVALLLIGVIPASGLSRAKAWAVTAGVVVVLLALSALPGFLASKMGGMETIQPFFFF